MALAVGDELGLEVAVAVSGHFERHFALVAFEVFAAGAVAGIARASAFVGMLFVAQVVGHLRLEDALD